MNRLTSLPESIGDLRSLKILDLDYNQLTNLPETIINLQNLEDLRVAHNQLMTLPDTIGNLRQLKILETNKLYLEGNQSTSEVSDMDAKLTTRNQFLQGVQLRLQNEPLNDMTQIRQLISRHTSDDNFRRHVSRTSRSINSTKLQTTIQLMTLKNELREPFNENNDNDLPDEKPLNDVTIQTSCYRGMTGFTIQTTT